MPRLRCFTQFSNYVYTVRLWIQRKLKWSDSPALSKSWAKKHITAPSLLDSPNPSQDSQEKMIFIHQEKPHKPSSGYLLVLLQGMPHFEPRQRRIEVRYIDSFWTPCRITNSSTNLYWCILYNIGKKNMLILIRSSYTFLDPNTAIFPQFQILFSEPIIPKHKY